MISICSLEKLTTIYYDILKKSAVREAATVVITKGPLVLGVSRGDNIQWGLPGGKVESGETPEQAAIREIWEETGIKINRDNIKLIQRSMEGPFFVHCFLYIGETPTKFKASEEGIVQWVSWEDLFKGPFGISNRRIFLELNNGRH